MCDIPPAVNETEKSDNTLSNAKRRPQNDCNNDSSCCHSAVNRCQVLTEDYTPLPIARDEPCHVCGKKPTSSVRRGTGQYLCYDCLKSAKQPGKAVPLAGVLDHAEFVRATAELGRCDICKKERAVYRSKEQQTSICENCYAGLVRGWNERGGVR